MEKHERNEKFLIHVYNYIDLEIIWETVKNNLPPLINDLEKIIKINKEKS